MSGRTTAGKSGSKQAPTAAAANPSTAYPATSPAPAQLLHDLNQPLSAINTYAQAGAQLVAGGEVDAATLKDLFSKISAQCARATALSQELRKTLAPPNP